jgi:uncharacterized surface protein with fasciclin (FAS1) repeats
MKILKGSSLEDTLNGMGPFTILAPVNIAFEKLASSAFAHHEKQATNSHLSNALLGHVLGEKRLFRDFRDGQKLKTINGKELLVTIKNGVAHINGAKILARDRQGSNGVIHSVDALNIPSEIGSEAH